MQLPLQITWRNLEPSPALERSIRDHAAKLERVYGRIVSCRVMVEAPHRHHAKGKLYHVRIDLSVPGQELAVTRDPPKNQAREDVYVAVRDAFEAARRQLRAHRSRRWSRSSKLDMLAS
jgi:ribosome-associated translation inhibitor RaiA